MVFIKRLRVQRNVISFTPAILIFEEIALYPDSVGCVSGCVYVVLFVVFLLTRSQRIEHEHADGHGAYTSGNGGYGAAHGSNMFEVHVTGKPESLGGSGIGYTRGAHINDCGTGLHHVCGDESRASDGGNEDVSLSAFLLDVAKRKSPWNADS